MAVITIDGPAGAGKSTIAKELARRLGFTYLDTGAMYRAVALAAKKNKVPLDDEKSLSALLKRIKIHFNGERIFLNGEDVSALIRTREMDKASSDISRQPIVRKFLTRIQREMARGGDIVAEGRDMGTVVFPGADIKFYITASPEVRAKRRQAQLSEKGEKAPFDRLLKEIVARDEADSSRKEAPLKRPEKSIKIDTSDLTIEEVFGMLMPQIKNLIG